MSIKFLIEKSVPKGGKKAQLNSSIVKSRFLIENFILTTPTTTTTTTTKERSNVANALIISAYKSVNVFTVITQLFFSFVLLILHLLEKLLYLARFALVQTLVSNV